ncbi:TPA: hypothetical protein DDZ86_00705 [Candidatus Dependentiae bacterium]|nr:MAG: hypothetical protein UW09_C0004G0021 [candidate division TM6 bacterium GW2011_GWF2_43_87]HBL98144.1 hypothetical protein [Candidatus Dependentiae bacterium]
MQHRFSVFLVPILLLMSAVGLLAGKDDSATGSDLVPQALATTCATEVCKPRVQCLKASDFIQKPLVYAYDEDNCLSLLWENKAKFEGFYSKNARMLNDCNGSFDKIVAPGKFTLDSKFTHKYCNPECEWTRLSFTAGLRLKGTFGSPEAGFKTGITPIKDQEVVMGYHRHTFTLNVPIMRELWMELLLNDLLGVSFEQKHSFTMGLFSFQLGRGIALGDAYATVPDLLGYDPASGVEQYAPGFKFSGGFADDHKCDYDFYTAILNNRSDSFDAVNEKVRGQQFGHRYNQGRDFGALNFVVAGRLKSTLFDEKCRKLTLEPYALFDDERDQRVEVPGDASTKLGTIGLASEFMVGDFEFGFDSAINVGKQYVKGLDRNHIEKQIRTGFTDHAGIVNNFNGVYAEVNSNVTAVANNPDTGDLAGKKALFGTTNQALVDKNIATAVDFSKLGYLNGQVILKDDGTLSNLKNSDDRYRDPYVNKLQGVMFVCDAWYYFRQPDVKMAATIGYASGDDSPNVDYDGVSDSDVDGTYDGFISLQELYSGKRVRSSFLLSGKGSFPRVLSFPLKSNVAGGVPLSVTRFTNLMFTGGALWFEREWGHSIWKINPNVLAFWQQHPARLAVVDGREIFASRFLGTEANLYLEALVARGLTFFTVLGLFVPGSHFEDISGKPLSSAEQRYLDRRDRTGVGSTVEFAPTVGHDNAFFINAGFEYKF